MLLLPLAIDIARPVRSRADQQALVQAVFEAPPDEQETNWLEWKGSLALGGRDATGRATIAKAVLGFANRDPNAAARAMSGCAYLLVGVSPAALPGVEAVDAAQLEAQVGTYVGRNIDWRADYVVVEERSVLVITVEPPQWGDPLHAVRRTFNPADRGPVLQEGTVFVRHQASTDPASPADIDMLSRRAARRPGDQLEVDVQPAPETKLRAIDLTAEALHEYVLQEESNLLAPLAPPERRFPGHSASMQQVAAAFSGLGSRDQRSGEDYRTEVSAYLERLREELPDILPARALLHGVARLKLEVVNNTDATFTGVRVEVWLPPELRVTEWQNEVRGDAELPAPPRPYRSSGLFQLHARQRAFLPSSITRPAVFASDWRPDVDRRPDAVYVEYATEDVRAQGVTRLPSLWLVIDDLATEAVEVRWEATATNAARRLTGTLIVPVNDPPASVRELVADLPDDD